MPTVAIDPASLSLSAEDVALDVAPARFYLQDPRFLTFERWSAVVTSDNSLLPTPVPESQWRQWADRIYQITRATPRPEPFNHWRDWAFAWMRSI